MEKDGKTFYANIEIVDLVNQKISLIDEVYDFKNTIGEYKVRDRFSNEESLIDYAKYFKEHIYKNTNNTNKCSKNQITDPIIQEFMLKWLPKGNLD